MSPFLSVCSLSLPVSLVNRALYGHHTARWKSYRMSSWLRSNPCWPIRWGDASGGGWFSERYDLSTCWCNNTTRSTSSRFTMTHVNSAPCGHGRLWQTILHAHFMRNACVPCCSSSKWIIHICLAVEKTEEGNPGQSESIWNGVEKGTEINRQTDRLLEEGGEADKEKDLEEDCVWE